jgi:hypothetical protein
MIGNKIRLAALAKKQSPHVIMTQLFTSVCIGVKASANNTEISLVKVVNFIWASALNHHHFMRFCQEIGTEYEGLLYYPEVSWLSRR